MKQMLLENEDLIRQKRSVGSLLFSLTILNLPSLLYTPLLSHDREAKELEKQMDADWYRESLRLQRTMAQTELDEHNLREQLRQDQLATLRQQAKEAAERKALDRTEKFGTISGDFYAKFGTSCR
jgi:hypothetical protein